MGCDIHSFAEKRNAEGKWEQVPELHPFDWRSYGMYGWLAGVRNYSDVPPLSKPRGMPQDVSPDVAAECEHWDGDGHTHSWLSVDELAGFNYDSAVEDRRVTRQTGPNSWDGGQTCAPGEGEMTTYRAFLGEKFFNDLDRLKEAGAERVVFWFDN